MIEFGAPIRTRAATFFRAFTIDGAT